MSSYVAHVPEQSLTSALDALISPMILPGEDPHTYEAFRAALMEELAPESAYERLMAEQLVLLELDLVKHRTLRDALLLSEFREQAVGAFQKNEPGRVWAHIDHDAKNRAFDLVSNDPELRASALEELSKREISPQEIAARAHAHVLKDIEYHDRQIAEMEKRRRKLREDFDRLQASGRRRAVEDAETFEGAG